jgi:hypothetical protein
MYCNIVRGAVFFIWLIFIASKMQRFKRKRAPGVLLGADYAAASSVA